MPGSGAADSEVPALPSSSLGQWYKPQNKRQVWLHTMFALRRELQAVEEYAAMGDAARLQRWAERLAEHYREIPQMVPEWTDEVESESADLLLQAAAAADTDAAARAARRLARTCRGCHREYRALAAARFRGPDFQASRIVDDEGDSLSYADFMETLSRSLNRVKIAAEDGRWEAAEAAAGELQTRLTQLGRGCADCHTDAAPVERILGTATRNTLAALAKSIHTRDSKQTGRHLGEAAVQVCARCHGVHRTLSDLRRQLFGSEDP